MVCVRIVIPIIAAVLLLFTACQAAPQINNLILYPLIAEDCIKFNPDNVQAKEINGRWKVVDGDMWLLDFESSQAQAEKAAGIIKHYKMNSQCFVGRPNPPMSYYLVDGKAPEGPIAGEDCIPFDPNKIEAKQINGRWKIVDGDLWLLDFDQSANEAQRGLSIIRKYGFNFICYVGRPHPGMIYFRKGAVVQNLNGSLLNNIGKLLPGLSQGSQPGQANTPKIVIKTTVKPGHYKGASPAVISFNGIINVDRPCVIKYKFDRSDGAVGPEETLTFDQAGGKIVTDSWTLSTDYKGWEALHITSPVDMTANKAKFQVTLK